MNCRHCATPLVHTFLDLGFAPPSNAYLTAADLCRPETFFPLKVMVCDQCWLVQTEDYAAADALFTADYAYFSSTSTSWLASSAAESGRSAPSTAISLGAFVASERVPSQGRIRRLRRPKRVTYSYWHRPHF